MIPRCGRLLSSLFLTGWEMRLVVPLRPILWWAQGALLPPPARCWLYCGFVLMDSWVFQNDESSQLERLLADRKATSDLTSPEHLPPAMVAGLIFRIEIPRLGLSATVISGTSTKTLRRPLFHIPGNHL